MYQYFLSLQRSNSPFGANANFTSNFALNGWISRETSRSHIETRLSMEATGSKGASGNARDSSFQRATSKEHLTGSRG